MIQTGVGKRSMPRARNDQHHFRLRFRFVCLRCKTSNASLVLALPLVAVGSALEGAATRRTHHTLPLSYPCRGRGRGGISIPSSRLCVHPPCVIPYNQYTAPFLPNRGDVATPNHGPTSPRGHVEAAVLERLDLPPHIFRVARVLHSVLHSHRLQASAT